MFKAQLRRLRKSKGLSQYTLAEQLGLSRGQLANYEQGSREPDYETLKVIANYFGVTVDFLICGDKPVSTGHEGLVSPAHAGQEKSTLPLEEVRLINVYRLNPVNRDEIFAQTNIVGHVPISADIMADYAISMNDDSMLPSIKPEAKVIIRAQETFSNGQAVLAQLPEGTYTIRRATQTDDGGIILTPDNSSYPPQHYNLADIEILGIVTHLITDFT